MSLTYLCTLPLPDSWFAELRARAPGLEIHRAVPGETPDASLLNRVDILHTSEWFPDADEVPSLRCVQLDTSGVDHVRRTSLWTTQVPIVTLGGIAPVPMAEYAMMSVLELAHRMPLIESHRAARTWPDGAERLATLTPRRIAGATMGIVGYGRIGREIARLASAFGMRVLGVSRTGSAGGRGDLLDTGRSDPGEDRTRVFALSALPEVLRQSDVVVIVVPLTELTRGMLGADELGLLPPGALVVNIARGGILDEQALLSGLRSGRLGGAALDVFDQEPLAADSPWWGEPNVLVTPHVAGLSPQYHAQTLDLVVENIDRLTTGRPLMNEVDRVAGY